MSEVTKTQAVSRMSRTKNNLPLRQLAILAEKLRELPRELLYLRDAAVHFAKQDQDALTAGDLDLDVFQRVCRSEGVDGDLERLAHHANLLTTWIEARDAKGPWTQPLWTLVGTLQGYAIFSDDGDLDPDTIFDLQRPTVAKPLRRLRMIVPDGWEASEMPDGNWTLFGRGIFVNVFVLSSGEYKKIASRKLRLPKDSAVIPTTEQSFRCGESCGRRTLFHLKQNQELQGISYILKVPGGFLSASASAFTPGAMNTALLESVIATIRVAGAMKQEGHEEPEE